MNPRSTRPARSRHPIAIGPGPVQIVGFSTRSPQAQNRAGAQRSWRPFRRCWPAPRGPYKMSRAKADQAPRPNRCGRGILTARNLGGDMTLRFRPCGRHRKSERSLGGHCRRITIRGSVGLLGRLRKSACQWQIMAPRSLIEQTNGGSGSPARAGTRIRGAPVVDPSVDGAGAFLQPRRGREGARRLRQADRRGQGILANARVSIRARADANRHCPQP